MFDWIKFKCKCPKCKKEMNDFQSKDGECLMNKLDWRMVDNFYAICSNCETWVEFNYKGSLKKKRKLGDYQMIMKEPKE